MIKSILKHLILLTLLSALLACASMEDRLSCNEEALIGTWKADWRLEIWTFEPDGTLQCEGLCNYGAEFGYPERWEGDESANLWSGGVEYLKLHFTEFTFEGTETTTIAFHEPSQNFGPFGHLPASPKRPTMKYANGRRKADERRHVVLRGRPASEWRKPTPTCVLCSRRNHPVLLHEVGSANERSQTIGGLSRSPAQSPTPGFTGCRTNWEKRRAPVKFPRQFDE